MNTGPIWERFEKARRLEHIMHWADAAKIWREVGEDRQAEACEAILEATEKGDRYRARVTELMENAEYQAQRQAHEEIYGK